MKLGLRIFIGYFLIVGLTAWLSLKLVLDEVKPVVRQVSEATLVETAWALAATLQPLVKDGQLAGSAVAEKLRSLPMQTLDARIWALHKTGLVLRILVTDARGIVLFDSTGEAEGRDHSRWNDVVLTLRGEYGVRSTRSDPQDELSSVMYVAAPIRDGEKILGVLSVGMPNRSTQPYIERARKTLWQYGAILLVSSLVIGTGFTFWLIWSLRKLGEYVRSVQDHRQAQPPRFARGTELEKLTDAVETMRAQLDGKAYVEQYIHSLTHELKSPLSAIRASAELLHDTDMPAAQRQRFLHSIGEQSERLNGIIEALLELAKLEKIRALDRQEMIETDALLCRLKTENEVLATKKNLSFDVHTGAAQSISGDPFLLSRALQNLIDNALQFATPHSRVRLRSYQDNSGMVCMEVENDGPHIPEYALARIPERFYSLDRPDGSSGHGLGLTFVREIAALHGGQFKIANTATGVRATLTLPGESRP